MVQSRGNNVSDVISLRTATADQPDIALVPMTAAFAERLGHDFAAMEPWCRYPFTPHHLSRYLAAAEQGAPRLALLSGGVLAGAVGVRFNWLRGPYLQFLGVLDSFKGQRLGTLSVAWFEGEARRQNERNLWVAASDFNAAALNFYRKQGFEPIARLDDLVCEGKSEILMRKRLDSAAAP